MDRYDAFVNHLEGLLPLSEPYTLEVEYVEGAHILYGGGKKAEGLCTFSSRRRNAKIQVALERGGNGADCDLCILSTLAHEYRHIWQAFEIGCNPNGFNIAAELDATSFGNVTARRYLKKRVSASMKESFTKNQERILALARKAA